MMPWLILESASFTVLYGNNYNNEVEYMDGLQRSNLSGNSAFD
jgi:hypothetical protein